MINNENRQIYQEENFRAVANNESTLDPQLEFASPEYQEACSIIQTIEEQGFVAYLVGGCVRDLLLHRKVNDFDIVTSAKPEEIEAIFPNTKPVGKQFGIILLVGKTGSFEIATFRGEADYQDARRPQQVFWASAKEDAQRRDFTINGLFFHPQNGKIVDYVGGKEDIKNKIIRFIGDPQKRVQEDHLRILRAIRLKNVLNFQYAPETKKAVKENAASIQTLSAERIRDELNKILSSPFRAEGIKDLSELGVLPYILPEVEKMKEADQPPTYHAEGNVFEHTLLCLKKLPPDVSVEVAWAVLLHDVGKPATRREIIHPKKGPRTVFYGHVEESAKIAEQICRRLKFSKKDKDEVVFLVREHLKHKDIPTMKVARQRQWAQHPLMPKLLQVWKADGEGSWLGKKGKIDLSLYQQAKELYEEEQKRPKPPKPLLNGNEIMEILNISPGPKVGEILQKLVDAQLEEEVKTKKDAEEFIKKMGANQAPE